MSLLYEAARHQQSISKWIIGSVVFHVVAAVIFGVALRGDNAPPAAPPAIKTRLVKLGKKRDEKLLPRIVTPAAAPSTPPREKAPDQTSPPKAKKESVPEKKTPAKKEDAPKKSASELLKKALDSDSAAAPSAAELLQNRIEDEAEGSEDGTVVGTELSGRLKASYNDKILAQMKQNLSVPNSLSDEERISLRASVALSITPDGKLGFVKIKKSSRHEGFDNAVVATVRGSSPFPAPPPTLRDFYNSGVVVELCPVRCR